MLKERQEAQKDKADERHRVRLGGGLSLVGLMTRPDYYESQLKTGQYEVEGLGGSQLKSPPLYGTQTNFRYRVKPG